MLLPVSSRGVNQMKLDGLRLSDLPLVHTFIPSVLNTIEIQYTYQLYIGYDRDDPWYDNEKNWSDLINFIHSYIRNTSSSDFRVDIKANVLYGVDQRITAIWNILAAIAYKDGCDYFYPANDDLQLRTKGWTSAAIQLLQSCGVASNFGIVAFRDISACEYPTFHLTHRKHLDLHDGIYYPLPSHGAHQDTWIFSVYRAWNCSFFLPQYQLKNHVGLSVKARYDYGDDSKITFWVRRSRKYLYNRLMNFSTTDYNQSLIDLSHINSHVELKVPCSIEDKEKIDASLLADANK
ncbi:unnamed protein product [Adineta ricciae]|uniref:Uncharacterized protein n=1 Tax=Adineta ricciae TaxID=249248 RepID=A0A815U3S2_ADIRI|nr:unnamed protein product [Adineta ricciae]CAF1548943.1 unnamed protein product [Adineta ricciae]